MGAGRYGGWPAAGEDGGPGGWVGAAGRAVRAIQGSAGRGRRGGCLGEHAGVGHRVLQQAA